MDDLSLVLANNLKRFREVKRLSLDKVAEMTGVSKSMLGQIERGESNPTITTVWKIANGLKISFTELIKNPLSDIIVINKNDIKPMLEDDGRYRLYLFFPYEEGRRFEIYSVDIEAGGKLNAEGHSEGTEEFVTVYQGQITVMVEDKEYTIQKGDSIRFEADKPHGYRNSGNESAQINMVIHYRL